jgi:hypothetical protein
LPWSREEKEKGYLPIMAVISRGQSESGWLVSSLPALQIAELGDLAPASSLEPLTLGCALNIGSYMAQADFVGGGSIWSSSQKFGNGDRELAATSSSDSPLE